MGNLGIHAKVSQEIPGLTGILSDFSQEFVVLSGFYQDSILDFAKIPRSLWENLGYMQKLPGNSRTYWCHVKSFVVLSGIFALSA